MAHDVHIITPPKLTPVGLGTPNYYPRAARNAFSAIFRELKTGWLVNRTAGRDIGRLDRQY